MPSSIILGFSGSPVKNSNTDRLVKAMLEASGKSGEFIKLSEYNIRPCLACKKCVQDNICKVNDDFPKIAEKIKQAKALIIGAYTPYCQIDAFTKALLERFWSFRHVTNLLRNKLLATVVTGIAPQAVEAVSQAIALEAKDYEFMEVVGQLAIKGNVPCATCGRGDDCDLSGLKKFYGTAAKTADFSYVKVEDQCEVWNEAVNIGQLLASRL